MGAITVVFDTNVIISAAGFGGVPEDCVIRAFEEDIQVVTSPDALSELDRVLSYDHLPFSEWEQEVIPSAFLELTEAEIVEPDQNFNVSDDPDDDKFIECAVAVDADYLVSGDERHVQSIGDYRGVSIVSPHQFLAAVGRVD